MLTFEQKFTKTLLMERKSDSIPVAEAEPAPISDEQAFKNTLEPSTDPKSFDVNPNPAIDHKVQITNNQLQELHGWIKDLESWRQKLNGLESSSIQSKLNTAECETLFTNIARAETKTVTRIAQELGKLIESLKGNLISADISV